MLKRAVITGIGAVTPLGNELGTTWEGVKAGRNGIGRITKIDVSDIKVKLSAEVKDFEYPDKREGKRMDLFVQYGMAAAAEAVEASGLVSGENIDPYRFAVYAGSGIGGVTTLENEIKLNNERGNSKVSALLVPMIIGNMLPGQIAIKHGIKGPAIDIVTACACGTNSIGEAFRAIQHGYSDAVICGASEAPFAAVCFGGFVNMKAMSSSTDADRASIPFDRERDGFVMGEGAAMLALEEREHAIARNAYIIAEVAGYGTTCDAFHITQPDPSGAGAAMSMSLALESAGMGPSDISYINAHGTSTPYNDLYETRAIKEIFEKGAYNIPVSSTKSMTGHMLGAAGALEAAICAKAIEEGLVPPTINYRYADDGMDLDYVTEGARRMPIGCALSNSFGFGGHNATIILKRHE